MGLVSKIAWTAVVAWAIVSVIVASAIAFGDSGRASDKRDAVWAKIIADTSRGSWPSTLGLAKLFLESMDPTIHWVSDEFPSGRTKLIHSVGATAQFHFNWQSNNYTGLFQQADYGIVRVSGAKAWDVTKVNDPAGGDFTPGMGIKIFRDNQPSANFVAMRALQPQDSWNPFKYTWTNHVSPNNLNFALKLVAKKFETVSAWPNFVGLSDMATWDQQGNQVASPNFPFQLLFVPNPQLQTGFSDAFTQDLPSLLPQIPAGFTLWNVQAVAGTDFLPVTIGSVVLDTAFTTSNYADSTLFFRHQVFEEDLAKHPEWLAACKDAYACKVCPLDC